MKNHLNNKQLDIDKDRYRLLFSLDGVFGIFRTKSSVIISKNSLDYNLCGIWTHQSMSVEDVLNDILLMSRMGKVFLRNNDIVCIRINGIITSFCYNARTRVGSSPTDCFKIRKCFTDSEKKQFLYELHCSNQVLDVIEGKAVSIKNIDLESADVFAIDREYYQITADNVGDCIISDFSLFHIEQNSIRQINPFSKPFMEMNNALYYYYRATRFSRCPLLLLDRSELEMILDYQQLKAISV